jgi:hypothetical protein
LKGSAEHSELDSTVSHHNQSHQPQKLAAKVKRNRKPPTLPRIRHCSLCSENFEKEMLW